MNKDFYYSELKRLTKLFYKGFFKGARNGGHWTIFDEDGNKTGVAEDMKFILLPEDSKANLLHFVKMQWIILRITIFRGGGKKRMDIFLPAIWLLRRLTV